MRGCACAAIGILLLDLLVLDLLLVYGRYERPDRAIVDFGRGLSLAHGIGRILLRVDVSVCLYLQLLDSEFEALFKDLHGLGADMRPGGRYSACDQKFENHQILHILLADYLCDLLLFFIQQLHGIGAGFDQLLHFVELLLPQLLLQEFVQQHGAVGRLRHALGVEQPVGEAELSLLHLFVGLRLLLVVATIRQLALL